MGNPSASTQKARSWEEELNGKGLPAAFGEDFLGE